MEKIIDLRKLLKEKLPNSYRFIPGFLVNYARRLVHEDDLNEFMSLNGEKYGPEFVDAAIKELNPDLSYQGIDNIPSEGGAIVVSNHPLGGLDGVALLKVILGKRKDAYFLVNDVLMQLKNFGNLFVPVNKFGKNSKNYSEGFEKVFSSEHIKSLN